jgi:hypothetical protein
MIDMDDAKVIVEIVETLVKTIKTIFEIVKLHMEIE